MNLDDAIAGHTQWKNKFRVAISKQESMDAATIGKDDCCELGGWLHGEGLTLHRSIPEFASLVGEHKKFHNEAGKIAVAINAKKFDEAGKMVGAQPFSSASLAVGVAVNRLKKAIA